MKKHLEDVAEILKLPQTIIRLLLRHFDWNNEMLIESYFEKAEPQKFIQQILGCCEEIKILKNEHNEKETVCEICYENIKEMDLLTLTCGDRFCKRCWKQYIEEKIKSHNNLQMIICAGKDCNAVIEDKTVLSILDGEEAAVQYRKSVTRDFIATNAYLQTCPCCDTVGQAEGTEIPIVCACKAKFCLCGSRWHVPVDCACVKFWENKYDLEKETYQFLTTHTKQCPMCRTLIQKCGGCDHIKCANPLCLHEFCWSCMNNWDGHGSVCQQPPENLDKPSSLKAFNNSSKIYEKFARLLKSQSEFEKQVKNTWNEIQQSSGKCIDFRTIEQATETLFDCSHTLMNCAIFVFFLKENSDSQIFQENLRNFEAAVDRLEVHLEMEQPIDEEWWKIFENEMHYCQERNTAIIKHAEEIKEKGLFTPERL